MTTKNDPTLAKSDIDGRKEALTVLDPAITYFASLMKESGPYPERLCQKLDQSSIDWKDFGAGDRIGRIKNGNFDTEVNATLNEPVHKYRSVYRPSTGANDEGLIDGTSLCSERTPTGLTILHVRVQSSMWTEIKRRDGSKSVMLTSNPLDKWEVLDPSAARLLPLEPAE